MDDLFENCHMLRLRAHPDLCTDTRRTKDSDFLDSPPHPHERQLMTTKIIDGIKIGGRCNDKVGTARPHWKFPRIGGFDTVGSREFTAAFGPNYVFDRGEQLVQRPDRSDPIYTVRPTVCNVHRQGNSSLFDDDQS